MKSDLVDISVMVKHETEKAWLVTDGTNDVWLPKSQVEIDQGLQNAIATMRTMHTSARWCAPSACLPVTRRGDRRSEWARLHELDAPTRQFTIKRAIRVACVIRNDFADQRFDPLVKLCLF